jgi:hypothetical protein
LPPPAACPGAPLLAVILSCLFGVPMVYCNWLIFSIFSAFVGEKHLFRPFVFKMFSAFGICAVI